jgi:ankyrin repeat protein
MEEESIFEVLKLNSAIKLKQFIKNNPDCLEETYDDYDDRNAIHFSNAEQTEILIKAGLSPYSPDKEGVPGALSPIVFSTEELEKIENESVNSLFFLSEETSFDFAENFINKLKVCIKCGFNINFEFSEGKNALFYSIYPEVIPFLIEQGCDINKKDDYGKNALHYIDNPRQIKALLTNGIEILDIPHRSEKIEKIIQDVKIERIKNEKENLSEIFRESLNKKLTNRL